MKISSADYADYTERFKQKRKQEESIWNHFGEKS